MFCKCFCKFCFFKVDFYNMSIKVPYFWIACRTVVFCQCSECKFIVWIICKNACTKIFYNRFFMVFLEDINKGNERSVIKSSFLQRNDTTDIKCDNAVFWVCQLFVTNSLQFINAVFVFSFFYNAGKFNNFFFCVITDSGTCPCLFFEHVLNIFD